MSQKRHSPRLGVLTAGSRAESRWISDFTELTNLSSTASAAMSSTGLSAADGCSVPLLTTAYRRPCRAWGWRSS